MRTTSLSIVLFSALSLTGSPASQAFAQQAAEPERVKVKGETDDPTRLFRRPAELVARCGAVTVKDLGLWPDMNTAFEGKGLQFISRPLGGAINSRGETIVVLDELPVEGVTRSAALGVVQYVVKGRPSSGVINERGDVLGQVLVENPPGGEQRIRQETFVLRAPDKGATGPGTIEVVDVPQGQYLMPFGLGDDGVGIAWLTKRLAPRGWPDDGLPGTQGVLVERNAASGRYVVRPLIAPEKIPRGLISFYPVARNARGDVAVIMQTPTGERLPMKIRGDDGAWIETCPAYVVTLSQAGMVRDGKLELVGAPDGVQETASVALTDSGVLVVATTRHDNKKSIAGAAAWAGGVFTTFTDLGDEGRIQVCDANGALACGLFSFSSSVLSNRRQPVAPEEREARDQLRTSGVLWELSTGRMLTLDSLLPEGGPCTHITTAAAIRGNKVLCTGLIGGKVRGLVLTLPPKVGEGFAKAE